MEEKEAGMGGREVVVAIGLTGSRKSKHIVKWAMDRFLQQGNVSFKLLHVYSIITSVLTPMGSWKPIAQVGEDLAASYKQEVEWKKKKSLLSYQRALLERNKVVTKQVKSEIVMIESDDVAKAILQKVDSLGIRHLVIGATSTSIFSRKILSLKKMGETVSSVVLATAPDFCSVYVVADGKLQHVRAAEPEATTNVVVDSKSWSSEFTKSCTSSAFTTDLGSALSICLPQNTTAPLRPTKELIHHGGSNIASQSSSSYGAWFSDQISPGYLSFECTSSTLPPGNTPLTRSFTSSPCQGSLTSTSPSIGSSGTLPTGSLVTTTTEGQSVTGSSTSALAYQVSDISSRYLPFMYHCTQTFIHMQLSEHDTLMIDLRLQQEFYALTQNSDFSDKYLFPLNQLREFKKRMEEKHNLKEQKEKAIISSRKKEHKDAECNTKSSGEHTKKEIPQNIVYHFKKFTWKEIVEATCSFSDEFKIGSGSHGTVYKCKLHHTNVAIKVLHSKDYATNKQFLQELDIMSRVRHPHVLLLFGAVPEECCLVYEYMDNGSLEARLFQKNDTPPILWYDRFRLCWEVASALACLHNTTPNPIIHRDLKPANILLDQHLVSKIGDAGLGTVINMESKLTRELSLKTLYKETSPVGTFCYIDPEYQRTGRVSTKSDIYALGVVILQLLTAQPAIGIAYLVEDAIDEGTLMELLDPKAGKWPPEETMELALLGVQCVALRSRDRPGLGEKILPTLERLKDAANSAKKSASKSSNVTPPHFICPIFKDIMEDPYVAADGYTYDRKAIEQWLMEKNTSPITSFALPHKFIMPNYTLFEAIEQWKSER